MENNKKKIFFHDIKCRGSKKAHLLKKYGGWDRVSFHWEYDSLLTKNRVHYAIVTLGGGISGGVAATGFMVNGQFRPLGWRNPKVITNKR